MQANPNENYKRAAVILAAGRGTRLRGIAAPYAKTLLPIAGQPVIAYAVQAVADYVDTIVLVAHPATATAVHAAAMTALQKQVGTIILALQREPLGMADAIRIGLEALDDEYTVVVMCGDNIVLDGRNVARVLDCVQAQDGACASSWLAWTYRELEPDQARRFSVYRPLSNGRGVLVEKPENPPSKICWCGPVAFHSARDAQRRIAQLSLSARGEYEATDLMNSFLQAGESSHLLLSGHWFDIGTPQSLQEARAFIEEEPLPKGN